MDKLKNLSILQMAMILAGALLLRKVLNTKVAIVGKNETEKQDFLSELVAETKTDLVKEFEPVKSETVLPLLSSQTLEIRTPFNSPEMLSEAAQPLKFTNEYFK